VVEAPKEALCQKKAPPIISSLTRGGKFVIKKSGEVYEFWLLGAYGFCRFFEKIIFGHKAEEDCALKSGFLLI